MCQFSSLYRNSNVHPGVIPPLPPPPPPLPLTQTHTLTHSLNSKAAPGLYKL